MTTERCIYCSQEFHPTQGQGDHIISGQLGEFRNDLRFRRICRACNSLIGRSEQQFLQCGPEAFFRKVVQPALRRQRQSGPSARGALGMPPPKSVIRSGDHSELVKPIPGDHHAVTHVDHIVIRGEDGSDYEVPLFRGMRPEQLRKKVAAASITDSLQGILMALSAVILPLIALIAVGGPGALLASLDVDGLSAITLWTRQESLAAGIGFVIGLAGIGLGYPGQPHVVNRFMAMEDRKAIPTTRLIAISWCP